MRTFSKLFRRHEIFVLAMRQKTKAKIFLEDIYLILKGQKPAGLSTFNAVVQLNAQKDC